MYVKRVLLLKGRTHLRATVFAHPTEVPGKGQKGELHADETLDLMNIIRC